MDLSQIQSRDIVPLSCILDLTSKLCILCFDGKKTITVAFSDFTYLFAGCVGFLTEINVRAIVYR
jgi:hypothetical protein